MKKIIILLATVLVLSMVGSVLVYSIDFEMSAEPKVEVQNPMEEEKTSVTPVDAHKVTKSNDGKIVFKNYNNETVELKYSSATTTTDGRARKIYVDSNNRQYWVNSENIVVSIDNRDTSENRNTIDIPKDELITEKEANKIAELMAKGFYGDKFNDFEFVSVEATDRHFWYVYQQNFGVDGCISGAECGIILQPDGKLIVSGITNYDDTVGLDPALLADFTQEKLLDIAEANVRAVYMDSLVDWELRKIQVVKTDDGYALMFLVSAEYTDECGIQLTNSKRFYYGVS